MGEPSSRPSESRRTAQASRLAVPSWSSADQRRIEVKKMQLEATEEDVSELEEDVVRPVGLQSQVTTKNSLQKKTAQRSTGEDTSQ